MSELKVWCATIQPKMKNACDGAREVYLKADADKVIAEKDEELRRQKHKRCLTNAWWCLREEFYAEDCNCERWVDWAIKWYKRWLELAEKFKRAK